MIETKQTPPPRLPYDGSDEAFEFKYSYLWLKCEADALQTSENDLKNGVPCDLEPHRDFGQAMLDRIHARIAAGCPSRAIRKANSI